MASDTIPYDIVYTYKISDKRNAIVGREESDIKLIPFVITSSINVIDL